MGAVGRGRGGFFSFICTNEKRSAMTSPTGGVAEGRGADGPASGSFQRFIIYLAASGCGGALVDYLETSTTTKKVFFFF